MTEHCEWCPFAGCYHCEHQGVSGVGAGDLTCNNGGTTKAAPAGNRRLTTTTTEESNDGCF